MISALDDAQVRFSLTTRAVPREMMVGVVPLGEADHKPQIGDLVLAEVVKTGKNKRIETRQGVSMGIFKGDRIVGAFGNRYATQQFEGYVPSRLRLRCHLLSGGGVIGRVASQHSGVKRPTRLHLLGLVCDAEGRPLNQRSFALPLLPQERVGEVIAVVGTSMDSGKTTLAGTLVRALVQAGYRVAAAKVTGTAAGRDSRFYTSCGASPVLDFIDAGYPATYMLEPGQLMMAQSVILTQLWASRPDYVVLEIADGIFQRETRMLLESWAIEGTVDHVFFAASDSLGAESGVRHLRQYGLPLRATSGLITRSRLSRREAEEVTGVSCLTLARLLKGDALRVLGVEGDGAVAADSSALRNGHTDFNTVAPSDTVIGAK